MKDDISLEKIKSAVSGAQRKKTHTHNEYKRQFSLVKKTWNQNKHTNFLVDWEPWRPDEDDTQRTEATNNSISTFFIIIIIIYGELRIDEGTALKIILLLQEMIE